MKKLVPTNAVLIPDQAKLVFHGVLFDIYQWQQTVYDGTVETFEMLKRADTVTTIAVVDDAIIVLEDENPHQGKRLSFPGGRVELSDPDIKAAAERETLEETGYRFNNWRLIKVAQPMNEIEWFVHVFVASGVKSHQALSLDAGERIKVLKWSMPKLKQELQNDTGVLGENRRIFEPLKTVDDLMTLAEFKGRMIDA